MRWTILPVGLCCFLLGAGASLGIRSIVLTERSQQSVEQLAHEPLYHKVAARVLEDQIVLRGSLVSASLDSFQLESGGVVTALQGQNSGFGTVVLEISGRPVWVMPGQLPPYRDLVPGDSGPDVAQFNQALASLGYDAAGDVFDRRMADAVTDLYQSAGYELPTVGEDRVTELSVQVVAGKRTLDELEQDLQRARVDAEATRTGSTDLESDVEESTSDDDEQLLGRLVEDLERAVDAARSQYEAASAELAEAELLAGPMISASEVFFTSDTDLSLDPTLEVGATVGPEQILFSAGDDPTAEFPLTSSQASVITTGMDVEIDISGDTYSSTLAIEERESGAFAVASIPRYTDELDPSSTTALGRLVLATTDNPVLALPMSAIGSGPDGSSHSVVRAPRPGEPKEEDKIVLVDTGLEAAGWVEILSGDIQQGDEVRVGWKP